MPKPVCYFVARLIRQFTGYDYDFMTAADKFLRECIPNFFDGAAHGWRDRKKCTENDRDFHRKDSGSFKIWRSESVALPISKRCSKQRRALARIAARTV